MHECLKHFQVDLEFIDGKGGLTGQLSEVYKVGLLLWD
jgi:hypothetical protein